MSERVGSIKVLHVDDEPDFAEMAATFVEREDEQFEVETASSANEALDRLADNDYECVVSDYDMPCQNGIEFLKAVRETHPDLPFILYTGKGSEEVASDAISVGATDYLQKESGSGQYELLANRIENAVLQAQSQQAERHLRELAENTEQVLFIFSHDRSELQFINSAYEDIWGRSVETLRDEPTDFLNGIHPDDRDRMRQAMERMSDGETVQLEYRVNQVEDYERWVAVRGEPITTVTGDVNRVAGFATDITERKRQEQELERSRDLLRHTEQLTNIGGWEVDTATGKQRWTDGTYAIHDLSPESFDPTVEKGIEFYHPDDRDTIEEAVSRCRETGEPYEVECRMITAEDRVRWVRANGEAVTEDGGIIALRGAIQDITEPKERERELELAEAVFQHAQDGIFIVDVVDETEFRVERVNPAYERQTGLNATEIRGKSPRDIVKDEVGAEIEARYRECVTERAPMQYEETFPVDGEAKHWQTTLAPVIKDGSVVRLVGATRDITDQRERQRRLEQTSARLEQLFENAPDMIDVRDSDGTLIDANCRFCEKLGYEKEEVIGRPLWEIDQIVEPTDVPELLGNFTAGERRKFEGRYERADGSTFPVEVHIRQYELHDEVRFLAFSRDITARKNQQQDLEETTRQFQTVLDTVEAAIFFKDTNGRYQLLNEECKELLGLDLGTEINGITDADLFPEEVAKQFRADDQRVLQRGETIEIEEEFPMPEGPRTFLTLKSPLFDEAGDPVGICAVATDIDDRKERERALQARVTAMEASIDGMAILDANEEYVFVNQAHAEIYGYDDPDAFLGETWHKCYDEDQIIHLENEVMPKIHENEGWRGEAVGTRKDGSTFPQELSLSVIDDGDIVCVVRDITERKERELELERSQRRYSALFKHTHDAITWIEYEGETPVIQAINPAFEDLFVPNNEDVIGRDLDRVVASSDRIDEARDISQQVSEGQHLCGLLTRDTVDGPRDFLWQAVPIEDPGTGESDAGFAVYADITEQKDRERTLEALVQRVGDLIEPSSKPRIGEVVVEIANEEFNAELAGLHLLSEDGQRLEAVAAKDKVREEFGVPLSYDQPGETTAEAVIWEAFENGEQLYIEDTEEYGTLAEESPVKSVLIQPIKDHGVFIISATETDAFDQSDRNYIELLAQTLTAVLDRVEGESRLRAHREQLERLHETSRRLMTAETETEIAEYVAEAAENIFDLPMVMVRYYDEQEGGLVPVTASGALDDVFDSRPIFSPEDGSLNWEAYESGTSAIYDDLNEIERAFDSESPVRSLIILPVGDYGTISAGATAPAAFDESEVSRAEILASTAEIALSRLEFETHLIERQQRLERQRNRFEQFAGVVSHDLRNPLNVATGSLNLAQEEYDSDHLDAVGRSLKRMETLIDDLLSLAQAGDIVGELETVPLEDIVETCRRTVDAENSEVIVESAMVVKADESRLQQLFENLFRNAVDHGGESVTVTVGELTDGFYVADDGPGIPEDVRENVLEAGFSTAESGIGLGLNIVQEIAEAHGWNVSLTDSAEGGARFEFTGLKIG